MYGLPWCLPKVFKNCVYLDFLFLGFKWPKKPTDGYITAKGDCCEMLCCFIPGCKPEPTPEPEVKVTVEGVENSQA